MLQAISREDIRLVYTFKERLGSGSFGSVRTAYKTRNESKLYAVKSIPRDLIEAS
jgi:serine/threonine protein kinase